MSGIRCIDEYVAEIVANAPPLTPEQRDRLALLLRGAPTIAPTTGKGRRPRRASVSPTTPPAAKRAGGRRGVS